MKISQNLNTQPSILQPFCAEDPLVSAQTDWMEGKTHLALLKCLHGFYLNPQQPAESHFLLGRIFSTLNDLRSAENALENALALQPDNAKIRTKLAKIKAMATQHKSSNFKNNVLLQQEKRFHSDMAEHYNKLNQFQKAIDHYHQILKLTPFCANTYLKLGTAYMEIDCSEQALITSLYSFYLHPQQSSNVHCLLSLIWRYMKAIQFAEKALHNALALDPDNISALVNLSAIYFDNNSFDESIALSRRVLAISPKQGVAYYNLASALSKKSLFVEAESAFEEALKSPLERQKMLFESMVHGGISCLKMEKNDIAGALKEIDLAISIKPKFMPWHFNRGIILLKMGRFLEAWEDFELRFDIPEVRSGGRPNPKIYHTLWQNQDLANRRLLVLGDEGRGDTFQHVRYLPLLKQRGATVILQTDTSVLEFLKTQSQCEVSEWLDFNTPPPKFDYYVTLTSLPHRFQTELHTIPPLLTWRVNPVLPPRLPKTKHRLRVGLVWAGDPTHKNNYNRSMALSTLTPLLSHSDICFYSLQYGKHSEDIKTFGLENHIVNLAPQIQGWKDTAELILELDLVITVDTAVAHFSASLGKPTWVMLPFCAEFRWMLDRTDSPWYPTMRLFRQQQPQNWSNVITEIGHHIKMMHRTMPPSNADIFAIEHRIK